jgi:hypothetical protein
LDVDTPRAAALFGDIHDVDVGRYGARRARHRSLVFVLLRSVELGLYTWVNYRLVRKIQGCKTSLAILQNISCHLPPTLLYGIVTVMVT